MEIKASKIKLSWIEDGFCFVVLGLLALLPILQLILRYVQLFLNQFQSTNQLQITIHDFKGIVTHVFLLVGCFAMMFTTKAGEHISITITQFIKNEKVKNILAICCTMISVFLLTTLAFNCIAFLKFGLVGKQVGFLPAFVFGIAMPLCYAVMAVRFCLKQTSPRQRMFAFAALLLGIIAALPAITKVIWGFEPPEPFFTWVNLLYDAAAVIHTPAIIFLILSALCGMPIFAAIGGIAMIILQAAGQEPDAASIQIYSALTEQDIIAIPLFTLTGFFLSESKAGERLVRTFRAFLGWMPGGMIIATVIICVFFTSFTGASGVTILALGGILYQILRDNKYSEKFSLGLLTSAGGVGLMFPPSLPIILVASTSNTILYYMNIPTPYDIVHYFIGAIIPGIILTAAMIFMGMVLSSKVKIPTEPFNSKEALGAFKESIFEILLPVILLVGYFSGRLSLVETSAVSVIYAVIIEVFVKKDIDLFDVPKVFAKAVPIIGGVLAILAMAKALSYAFIASGVPESFVFWMQNVINSKYIFLLLLNLALLVLGCLMDIFSAILVFLPLIVPLGHAYGVDPVHLGIIFIVNLEAGFLTPPVGMNLFLASYRFEKPFMQICRSVLPFLNIRFVIVLLVTYLPFLTTGILSLIIK